ncbi:DUF6514 family protein [uncultured Clostridium sp.]|uniref:DUF6514 family protein n=1 Tax=uncultured Clostridium sp. TaxID=59620 RepID=UPI00260C3357|nr:DUF6514 family protein [uncultured Clostridium sp.]
MINENFVFVRMTNGIERKYIYRLIDNVVNKNNIYGIEIERIDCIKDEIIDSFKDSVELISPNKEKVERLLVMLYENGVSPLHLIDIAGEFIDECVNDFVAIGL